MAKDPAFLMYSKDWIEGTADMTPEEKGVYIDLLCYQHQRNGLPNDLTRLSRLVRMPHNDFLKIWKFIKTKFVLNGENLRNEKLSEVMADRAEKGRKNKITGNFAAILRQSSLSTDDYSYIKSQFNLNDFNGIPDDLLKERITEWITERLLCRSKSIEDGNEDASLNKINNVAASKEKFIPPTILEVEAYIKEKNYQVDAENFIDFYSSKGWMIGKSKMKDWKAAIRNARNWEHNQKFSILNSATKPSNGKNYSSSSMEEIYGISGN